MKSRDFFVRSLGYKLKDGQWFAICLDFDLAAQGDSPHEVFNKLSAQIKSHIRDALTGPDKDAAWWLMHRRAPMKYWAQFYAVRLLNIMHKPPRDMRSRWQPLPLVPAVA